VSRNIKSEEALTAFQIAYTMLRTSISMINDLDNAIEPVLRQEIIELKKELINDRLLEEVVIRQNYLELLESKSNLK